MKALTATRPSDPVVESTCPTSVTCSADQSVAVPSASPKASAMTASSQATVGILVRLPSALRGTTAVGGVIANVAASTATASTVRNSISGMTTAAPSRSSRVAITSTLPAPMKPPTDHSAWNRLMTGRWRARSTCTPMAFIATSMAPLPSPSSTAAATATGNVVAKAIVIAAAMSKGRLANATWRAPIESDSRPPTCMAVIAASAAVKSRTEMSLAPISSRSRMDGRAPPYPPRISPFTANRSATATTDRVVARRAVSGWGMVPAESMVMWVSPGSW